jgi:hypothetical protein
MNLSLNIDFPLGRCVGEMLRRQRALIDRSIRHDDWAEISAAVLAAMEEASLAAARRKVGHHA